MGQTLRLPALGTPNAFTGLTAARGLQAMLADRVAAERWAAPSLAGVRATERARKAAFREMYLALPPT